MLFLLPECGKLMVVEYKKRDLTNNVKTQGYGMELLFVTNEENRLGTCER